LANSAIENVAIQIGVEKFLDPALLPGGEAATDGTFPKLHSTE
jgi:hypothetical protein